MIAMSESSPDPMQDENQKEEPMLVSTRAVDMATAALLVALAAIVIYDSVRIGYGWLEGQGPAPGMFPFIVAVLLGCASLVNFFQAALYPSDDQREGFVTLPAFMRVLSVLAPLAIYVFAIQFLGIYVASALFIGGFMVFIGGEGPIKSAIVGVAVPLVLFFMFERWFLVPLPKGPLEAMLGF